MKKIEDCASFKEAVNAMQTHAIGLYDFWSY